jgi:hypothetical protein
LNESINPFGVASFLDRVVDPDPAWAKNTRSIFDDEASVSADLIVKSIVVSPVISG